MEPRPQFSRKTRVAFCSANGLLKSPQLLLIDAKGTVRRGTRGERQMSYRDDEGYDPGTGKKSFWYWPKLDSLDASYAVAHKAFGGWVFAGMIVLGAAVTYFSGKSAIDFKTTETDVAGAVVGAGIELLFVLFASYRIRIGRGWIISWFLLALFGAEAVTKFIGGGPAVIGWIFFYIAIGSSILAGARACWDIRARSRAGEGRTSDQDLQTIFE